jgi:hypothetical protein
LLPDLLAMAPPSGDGAQFDPARSASSTAIEVPAPQGADADDVGTVGMGFWYATLAPAIGNDAASAAARLWQGDATWSTGTEQRPCLTATVATASPEAQAALLNAFTQWAGSRPQEAEATASAQPGNTLSVHSCEVPGQVAPSLASLGPFYQAGFTGRLILDRLVDAGMVDTAPARACSLNGLAGLDAASFTAAANDLGTPLGAPLLAIRDQCNTAS